MSEHCETCAHHDSGPVDCLMLVPVFSGLSPRERAELSLITHEKRYAKGETIYYAGKTEKRLFVLHSGKVKILRTGSTGRSQILRVIGPGEFFGELSVLNDTPLADTAEALEPCIMCAIEGARLAGLMQKYPSIALKILAALSARLERAESLIEDMGLYSAEHRLARALVGEADGRDEFDLSLAKGDFASRLGMTQETLSRKLAAFQESGYIGLRGQRSISILDRSGLERVAEDS